MTHNPPPRNTHTNTHTHAYIHKHTQPNTASIPLLPSSTDHEEYVQAALLMHIYTQHTLAHTLSRHSLKVIVCECVSICLSVHVLLKVTSSEADHMSRLCIDSWIDIKNILTGHQQIVLIKLALSLKTGNSLASLLMTPFQILNSTSY